jgi:hypothetical protein
MAMITCFSSYAANAQSIESLVMPGPVIHGHAELESECSSCHVTFSRSKQSVLCSECHEDVAGDILDNTGFHGRSSDVEGESCASCHTDHEGRNSNILGLDTATFDHQQTDFELLGKHPDAECDDCHKPDIKHREAPHGCFDCHAEDDVHEGYLGDACGDCHNPNDWLEIEFDHGSTDFPLVGKHIDAECSGCHADQTHQNMPMTCIGCHADDDSHEGRSGDKCENCHNPSSWQDASFDHASNTDFALEFTHATLTCVDCHSEDPFDDVMDMACASCHLEDDGHAGHQGTDCGSCHNSDAWSRPMFDHNFATDFMLNGAHETVACNDCHIEPVFETSPGDDCADCHKDDDPHGGALGEQCGSCHSEVKWLDAPFFDHDLVSFPLLGEHGNIECDDCHATQEFVDTGSACVDCHLDDDNHDGVFESNCESCHNPVAWDLWLFDHNTQTELVLSGAHVEVACDSCHRSTFASMKKTGDRCADCHVADDIHDGEFGADCGRCHSDRSFQDVRSLQ